ncbi:MAG: TetR/AcrR family transcriptional regulator [Actinomycetes bacterium]
MGRPQKIDDTALLDRATALFWRDGADAVTIRDLEVALGLKAPAIYRRYPSKNALIESCVERYMGRVVDSRIRRYLESSEDPLEGLRSFFVTTLEPHPGEETTRGCLLTVTANQTVFQDPSIRAAVRDGMDRIRAGFQTTIERGQTTGQIRTDVSAATQAMHLMLVLEGLLVLGRSGSTDVVEGVQLALDSLRPAAGRAGR